MKKRNIKIWPLSRLKCNSQQGETIDDLPDDELAMLVEDIRENGQLTPIEVTPGGEILDGNQRLRALEILGRKARVWVRHDLADQGQQALDKRYYEANLARRHLDCLGKLRLVKKLVELELGDLDTLDDRSRTKAKNRIAQRMGMSPRNLNRYLRVAKTPMAVQRAFSAGKIGLVNVGKVADCPPKVQKQIAAQIAKGDDPEAVVAALLRTKKTSGGPTPAVMLRTLLSALRRGEEYFADDSIEKVPRGMGRYTRELKAGQKTLQRIIDQLQ